MRLANPNPNSNLNPNQVYLMPATTGRVGLLPAAARLVSAVRLWDMSLPGEVDEGGTERMVPPLEA